MLNCWARVGHSTDHSLELFALGPTPCAGARLRETTRLEDAIKKIFEPGVLVWLHRARRDLVFATVMGWPGGNGGRQRLVGGDWTFEAQLPGKTGWMRSCCVVPPGELWSDLQPDVSETLQPEPCCGFAVYPCSDLLPGRVSDSAPFFANMRQLNVYHAETQKEGWQRAGAYIALELGGEKPWTLARGSHTGFMHDVATLKRSGTMQLVRACTNFWPHITLCYLEDVPEGARKTIVAKLQARLDAMLEFLKNVVPNDVGRVRALINPNPRLCQVGMLADGIHDAIPFKDLQRSKISIGRLLDQPDTRRFKAARRQSQLKRGKPLTAVAYYEKIAATERALAHEVDVLANELKHWCIQYQTSDLEQHLWYVPNSSLVSHRPCAPLNCITAALRNCLHRECWVELYSSQRSGKVAERGESDCELTGDEGLLSPRGPAGGSAVAAREVRILSLEETHVSQHGFLVTTSWTPPSRQ
jgi:hypothetical protein